MSYYDPKDNITGPDPREDDPTPRERKLHITVTFSVTREFSNRDAEDEIVALDSEISKAIRDGGFDNAEIDITE